MKNKVTLLNILSSFALQVITIISGFIVPKIILSYFGSSVNGLVSSLNQLLSYITLVEGGITGVIAANLYKPLIQKDQERISAVCTTAKSFYNKIAFLFIGYSIVLAICYPIFIATDFTAGYILLLTMILSINLLIQYMFSLTLKTLLDADKRGYIVSLSQIAITVLNMVLVYVSVHIYPSIHLVKLISGLLYIIQPLVYGYYIKKYYKINWKQPKNNDLIAERWNGFAINLAAFIHNSTDVTILTIFTNLRIVSVYSVYALVSNGLKRLIQSVTSGIAPTIGHAYAKNDLKELHSKMDLYEYIVFFLVGFLFTVAGLLITPFVMIYTKNITDAPYFQPLFGYLIVLSEALYLIKMPHLTLAYSANKFKELTVPAFIEAGLNIIISILLVPRLGLIGVAIGTCTAMTYRMMHQVYFTKTIVPSRGKRIYYKKLGLVSIATAIAIASCQIFFPLADFTIITWVLHAVIYSVILAIIYAAASLVFFKNEMAYFIRYLLKK